jgi:hypothetical protein
MRPGRHGGMSSGELELILARNGNFLSVRRAGSGDGQAGLYNGVTGEYLGGIGGGWLPEYSRNLSPKYDCECTPGGRCRSGAHGIYLVRGWRNIVYELLSKHRIRNTKEVRRLLGSIEAQQAEDYGLWTAPMHDPEASWNHSGLA